MLTFPLHRHVVMACHLTGIYDVNRSQVLPDDDYSLVQAWAESLEALSLQGILFHNNFSDATCARYQHEGLIFIKIAVDPAFSPNVFRYFAYRNFLNRYAPLPDALFVTDVSDVVVCNNPFVQPFFTEHSEALFCGDESKTLSDPWMVEHGAHLRNQIAGYADYETKFKDAPLLNCGIIGGYLPVMRNFIDQLCLIHEQYNRSNPTNYTGDMGAFNYLARTQFNDRLLHGFPCNTIFKGYENERTDSWFRHK